MDLVEFFQQINALECVGIADFIKLDKHEGNGKILAETPTQDQVIDIFIAIFPVGPI